MRYPNPNPSGICLCGCGQPTEIATTTSPGGVPYVKGFPKPYLPHHKTLAKKLANYSVDPRTGCHMWLGACTWQGNPIAMNTYGRTSTMRRIVFEHTDGIDLPMGSEVVMTCKQRRCINREHMEVVPKGQRLSKMWADKRKERHEAEQKLILENAAKRRQLSEEDRLIIVRSSASDTTLAKRFGVPESTIRFARTGQYGPEKTDNFAVRMDRLIKESQKSSGKRALKR